MSRLEQGTHTGYHGGVKYELQTIPVWDAYEQQADCPLCYLERKLEADYQRFFLGSAVMAPDMRVEVNRIGFCGRHFGLLERGANRLGLALMTQTHLADRTRRFEKARRPAERAAGSAKTRKTRAELDALLEALAEEERSCMICDRLAADLANYTFTIVRLHRADENFAETFRSSHGFCLPHMRMTIEIAREVLRARELPYWLSDLFATQDAAVGSLTEGLEEMVARYDYRSTEPATDSIRAALPRAISKIVGRR
ncbi:MAG: DUF6062 family protein [Spirochaetaceae bacterium]